MKSGWKVAILWALSFATICRPLGMPAEQNAEPRQAGDSLSTPQLFSIHSLVQSSPASQVNRHVTVRGTVVYQVPGQVIYLQDGNDGIEVQTSYKGTIEPGRMVEANGVAVVGDDASTLQEGTITLLSGTKEIAPVLIGPKEFKHWLESFDRNPHQQLVTVQGEVVESHLEDSERIWILRQSGIYFAAHLPVTGAGIEKNDINPGNTIQLTGIGRIHAGAGHGPVALQLLLRGPDDVGLLHRPSWWTLGNTISLVAIIIMLVLVLGLLDIVQKRNVREQTRIIRESEQRFRDLAESDVLTGLPNRLTLEDRIADTLAICDRESVQAAILTVDIDRFKQINDTFGHLVGDECLKAVAERLKSKIRTGDTVARTGGEEFTLIIGRLNSREGAQKVCTTLLNLFKEPLILSDRGMPLTVSIGAAMYPEDGTDSTTLRKRSDQALYEAKRTGRNRVVFASQELSESSEFASLVEARLRDDLRFNRFRLYFQPICDENQHVCRFEALLRSPNMHLAKIGPGQFIPIAEECGLIIPLGRWVIREVCRQMAEWRAQGMTLCPVAVNVSGRQLFRKEFVSEVLQDLRRHNIQPEMLELELTETTLMNRLGSAADTIAELAQAGLSFAIDDFGTGYSSLSRLNQLPIKALKIDASFVKKLEMESGSYTIVRAVMQMAKSLGLSVIAEGIESQDQFDILRGLGCDFFQGYLIAKPMPAEDAITKIEMNKMQHIQNQTSPHWSSHLVARNI